MFVGKLRTANFITDEYIIYNRETSYITVPYIYPTGNRNQEAP